MSSAGLANNAVISQIPGRQRFPAETLGRAFFPQYPTAGGISENTMAGKHRGERSNMPGDTLFKSQRRSTQRRSALRASLNENNVGVADICTLNTSYIYIGPVRGRYSKSLLRAAAPFKGLRSSDHKTEAANFAHELMKSDHKLCPVTAYKVL